MYEYQQNLCRTFCYTLSCVPTGATKSWVVFFRKLKLSPYVYSRCPRIGDLCKPPCACCFDRQHSSTSCFWNFANLSLNKVYQLIYWHNSFGSSVTFLVQPSRFIVFCREPGSGRKHNLLLKNILSDLNTSTLTLRSLDKNFQGAVVPFFHPATILLILLLSHHCPCVIGLVQSRGTEVVFFRIAWFTPTYACMNKAYYTEYSFKVSIDNKYSTTRTRIYLFLHVYWKGRHLLVVLVAFPVGEHIEVEGSGKGGMALPWNLSRDLMFGIMSRSALRYPVQCCSWCILFNYLDLFGDSNDKWITLCMAGHANKVKWLLYMAEKSTSLNCTAHGSFAEMTARTKE